MRWLLFILALPLGASPIINSTSVQTTCHWIDGLPTQPDFTLSDSNSGTGSSTVSCPDNYGGPSPSASSTVSGADATAGAALGQAFGIASGEAQAYAGFEVSGIASQDGTLPLNFLIVFTVLTDASTAQVSVTFYFNGVQIGEFAQHHRGAGGYQQEEVIENFVKPVSAGEAYTFGAQAFAQAGPHVYTAVATAEVSELPEPATIFLVGFVCVGLFLVRARARKTATGR